MIVLANEEFATGLRLAGVKNSHYIKNSEQLEEIMKDIKQDEFIIATQGIINLSPNLQDYPNLIEFPDTIQDFSRVDDLKKIIRIAIGSEVEI